LCKDTRKKLEKKFFIQKLSCIFAVQKSKTMKVATENVTFDVFKTLHVIEHDKILDGIFRESTAISYNVLRTMSKTKTINHEIYQTIEEMFTHLIQNNPAKLKKYNNVKEEDTEPSVSKYYGKQRILQDIETTGEKTELDKAMIALNEFKNIYAKLRRRGIKDKIHGTKVLTVQDCRTITAMVRMMKNNFEPILKKK
jgi:hypothetical protein